MVAYSSLNIIDYTHTYSGGADLTKAPSPTPYRLGNKDCFRPRGYDRRRESQSVLFDGILQSIFTKVTDAEPRGNSDLHALTQLRERTGAVLGSNEAEAEQGIRAEEDEDTGEIRDGDDGDDDGGDDGGEFGTEIEHEEELGVAYMLIMEQDYQRQVARHRRWLQWRVRPRWR
jgi:hypothetical protein